MLDGVYPLLVLLAASVAALLQLMRSRRRELGCCPPIRAGPVWARPSRGCLWQDGMAHYLSPNAHLATAGSWAIVAVAKDADAPSENAASSGSEEGARSAARVLVADDDPGVRQVLQFALQAAGYDVRVVSDGQAAIDLLREARFDVVVTDLAMPKREGADVLREAVAQDRPPRVIVITGQTAPEIEPEMIRLGAECVVRKPFDVTSLIALVGAAAA